MKGEIEGREGVKGEGEREEGSEGRDKGEGVKGEIEGKGGYSSEGASRGWPTGLSQVLHAVY